MKQYRVPFFTRLRDQLQGEGIGLKVAYSGPPASEWARRDNAELPDDFGVRVRGYRFLHERLLYQPLIKEIAHADLVIVEHANKHILNHILLLLRAAGLKRIGFWGLGNNKQADQSRFSEWYKRTTIRCTDSYFAYTEAVAREVGEWGVPIEKITVVHNAVDTRGFARQIGLVRDDELALARRQLGIRSDAPTGLFCGMLDTVKGVPFLMECCKIVKRELPEFHLILLGGGVEQDTIKQLVQALPWVHMLGPKFEREKAVFFKLSDLFLLPGRVGLVILDSFAAGLPLITVRIPIHGPEIEYLEDGRNGFMVPRDPATFATVVIRVLKDRALLQRLKQGAARSAERFTIDVMVDNFRSGIHRCLDDESSRSRYKREVRCQS
jgi:glycosyltransferase involved in cell wall biosynthesis